MTKPKTILMIDNEPALLFGIKAIARRAGYNVLTANHGKKGLELAHSHHPDLIVCDVMMPPPNGFELCKLLSNNPETSHIPFIFLTSRSSKDEMLAGLRAGADDYIKPFRREVLLARIEATLRRVSLIAGREKSLAQSRISKLSRSKFVISRQSRHNSIMV